MKKMLLISALFCATLGAADNNGAGGPFHGLAHRGEHPLVAIDNMWYERMQTIPAWKRATALGVIAIGAYLTLSDGQASLWDSQGNFNIMAIFNA